MFEYRLKYYPTHYGTNHLHLLEVYGTNEQEIKEILNLVLEFKEKKLKEQKEKNGN